MNNLYHLLLLILCLGFLNTAQAADGTIRGTITDANSGEPLIGANILVKGTSIGATTDIDGEFELSLSPGTYNIRISYISYQTVTIKKMKIKPGNIRVLGNIPLKSASEKMKEVVVTAESMNISEAALMTKKKKSTNLLDGISAEKIKKAGASNAAGALKKVTGVSVQGGKYVYVRGLGDRYTKTMLNSVEIPSLDPNKNSLQIDIFPTSIIDNLVINKTATADLPADFTGGIVNIKTKDFPDKPIFDISASVAYNPSMHLNDDFLTYPGSDTDFLGFDGGARALPEQADKANIPTPLNNASDEEVYNFTNSLNPTLEPNRQKNSPDYSLGLTLGNQFNIGGKNKLGYIVSATYKKSTKQYADYQNNEYQIPIDASKNELIYANKQRGSVSKKDILAGGLAGLSFKTKQSKIKLTGMHLQNGNAKTTNLVVNNSQSAPGQSGYTADSNNLEYGQRGITNVLLDGSHYFKESDWDISWKLSSTFSDMKDPDIRKTTYTRSASGGAPTFNAGAGGFPSRIWRCLNEDNLVGRAKISKEYSLFGEDAKLKFGGSHLYKQRDYKILQYDLAFFGSQPALSGNPEEILQDKNLYGNGGTIYFKAGNPDPNPNAYNSNVHNTALYLSNEFHPLPALNVNLGLRAEKYVQRHTGRDVRFAQGDQSGNSLDNEKVLDALDLFPSVNLTYALSDQMNLRFSYSRTIARPSFRELSFAQILDPVSDRIFNGGLFPIGSWDGGLGETSIQNLDLRWEHFSDRGQLLSASLFYKSFTDPIELVRIRAQATTNEYQPRNVGNGKVYGAEFEVRQSLGMLSPALSKFSVSSNLTLVKSVINMTDEEFNARKKREKNGQNVDDKRQMAGQAPYIINAGLEYNKSEIGLNAGFFYNVKGETLMLVGGGLFPDVYSDPYHSLKFNMDKSFGKATLSLSVSNILGQQRTKVYQGYQAKDQVNTQYSPHRTVSLGFEYSF